MRGLPGSGKSTHVAKMGVDAVVCSADHYHVVDGTYRFDPARAGEAHNACLRKYVETLILPQYLTVVVDNTNTSLMELSPYVRLAEALGVEYEIHYILCSVVTALQRNVHAVPATTILKMHKNLVTEELPPWWRVRVFV